MVAISLETSVFFKLLKFGHKPNPADQGILFEPFGENDLHNEPLPDPNQIGRAQRNRKPPPYLQDYVVN